jgi:peptidoglycan hydrolase CwlO-like protein
MHRSRPILAIPLAALALWPAQASAQSEGTLRGRIDQGRSREQALASAASRLGRLERAVTREVAVLESRLAEVQADLTTAETKLAATEQRLAVARRRVARLRARLATYRRHLAERLRERYKSGRPTLVTVVLNVDGFQQLLETIAFLNDAERADARLVALVRTARLEAGREQHRLTGLAVRQREQADAVERRRNALAGITSAVRARRDSLQRAHVARLAALSSARADRQSAQRALTRLLAARARAASSPGPGGPWAIPWPIVQCESGGQNLPPNHAGASGYYQMLPSTWRGLGGSTPHAYQASKAEQDRHAATLWDGGRGARNWVCAAMVGEI